MQTLSLNSLIETAQTVFHLNYAEIGWTRMKTALYKSTSTSESTEQYSALNYNPLHATIPDICQSR